MIFDVIVIGGGPAGATAAKALGEAGVSALLLDKSAFPRDKPCGGGISARVVKRFPYLESALAGIPTKWLSKVYFESPGGAAVDYESSQPLYLMIRRCEFDHLLFSLVQGRVECRTGALVRKIAFQADCAVVTAEIDGEQQEYRGRIILGCDGANSVVARAAGLRTGGVQDEYAIDMMEETPYQELNIADRDRMYIYYRIRGQYGYGYIFPKANHLNLGVGFKLDYYLSELRGRQYSYHRAFVDEQTSRRLLAGESNRANFRAFPLPISGPLGRTYSDRALVAGDAGGFVNAFTAEGIYYAMVSGDHAARAAIQAVRSGQFDATQLQAYEHSWKREIGEELVKSVDIQRRLLADPSRVDRVVRAASRNPALADLLARYATGALSHREFKRSLFLRALPLYLREKASRLATARRAPA
ncbi:MAG: geranylgeranyl reductase family protein [Acidobacteriia bacterium]|nr:geranylgeranyl reductase family protein [Terriglobia bacterium]